jgi:hypothetical protein
VGNKIGDGKGPKPGRPKGSQNKVGKEAKEIIAAAAAELGGQKRIVEWAQEDPLNERAFWTTIYPKLIPVTLGGEGANGEIIFKTVYEA